MSDALHAVLTAAMWLMAGFISVHAADYAINLAKAIRSDARNRKGRR